MWGLYRGNTNHCYWYSVPLFVYYVLYQLWKVLMEQISFSVCLF